MIMEEQDSICQIECKNDPLVGVNEVEYGPLVFSKYIVLLYNNRTQGVIFINRIL